MTYRRWLPGLALLGLLICLFAGTTAAAPPVPVDHGPTPSPTPARPAPLVLPADARGRLHPSLYRALTEAQPDTYHRIIVEWQPGAVPAAQAESAPDRLARRREVVATLQADAEQRSAPLRQALTTAVEAGQARNVRAFWASPVVALEAQPALIAALAGRDDVVQVRLDEPIFLQETIFTDAAGPQSASGVAWNLAMVRADLAATALGLDGTGVVVANMDTGVDWQHPALVTKYRGYRGHAPAVHYGNWHVSTGEPYLYPGDGDGHGTHTMGTMVGDDGAGGRVGVAPGARWIAVKLFANGGYTYESWIHDAFQWVMAPEGDPSLAPDVVNNSWGNDVGSDTRFRNDVKALRAAGILPVFSAGNRGPGSGTIGSPGSYAEALAVGALDQEGAIASFSSRGPNAWGNIKPDVAAPGVKVLSSFVGGGWALGTGTSMAAPHAAGLAALLRQASPTLSVDELDAILRGTARPMGDDLPNNDTGWGLIDAYAAGLRVTASGELAGKVVRADGAGISGATVSVTSRDGARPTLFAATDASGAFGVALLPGLYDLEASAFGFQPATAGSARVVSGERVTVTLPLAALPAGSVFGRVTDSQTGAPVSTTVAVDGTPVKTQTDPNTGLYSLALPEGSWNLRFTAAAHRIGHRAITVAAGAGLALDAALLPAPRILLVDGGRWYYESQIPFFTDALDALDYPFTLWPITSPAGQAGLPGEPPKLKTLKEHDVVIWSAPYDSPGVVGASGDLSAYLWAGGRLLVSGQDVAYLDGGGPFNPLASYFYSDMSLAWAGEGNVAPLTGALGGPLAGITVTMNTSDSARNQVHPDSVTQRSPTQTVPALIWPDAAIGGALAGTCRPYRAAWLGFGLEGAGPRETRIETTRRILDWFATPPAPYGFVVRDPPGLLIGRAGATLEAELRLDSTGVLTDTIDVHLEGGPWPAEIRLPGGGSITGDGTLNLPGCAKAESRLLVTIPSDAAVDARATYTVTFRSRGDPTIAKTVNLTAKTPAPILFVDDQRWYDYAASYTTTLNSLALSYDVFNTKGGSSTPLTDTLFNYGIVVWTTGYDWYEPLASRDETRLAAFLDHGGRLLLTGQDILDLTGIDSFVRDRLGVAAASLTVTTTEALSLPGGPLGGDLGPWRLTYPFTNWSDGLLPERDAFGTLQDRNQNTVAVAKRTPSWRTTFFAFPLETLDAAARQTLMGRAVLWLSPLGESRLEAPPFAASGSRFPITLTLGLATDGPREDLAARLPLPAEVSLAEGSLRGPWHYDAAERALIWTGALSPGAPLTLGADLDVAAGLPAGARLPLRARLYAGNGLTVSADAPVAVDVPWLAVREQASPAQTLPGGSVRYTITVQNIGLLPTTAHLTDTLPAEVKLVADSLWATRGAVASRNGRVQWSDVLEPGAQAQIGFTGVIGMISPGARLADWTEVTDDRGRRVVAWADVTVPARQYLPLVAKWVGATLAERRYLPLVPG